MIYSLFRNPLAHALGLDLERRQRTQKVVIKRLTTEGGTLGHSEGGIEALESNERPSKLSPLLHVEHGRVVLLVEAFYCEKDAFEVKRGCNANGGRRRLLGLVREARGLTSACSRRRGEARAAAAEAAR